MQRLRSGLLQGVRAKAARNQFRRADKETLFFPWTSSSLRRLQKQRMFKREASIVSLHELQRAMGLVEVQQR